MATLLSPVDEVTKLRIAPAIANVKYAQLPDRSVKPATANVKYAQLPDRSVKPATANVKHP